MKKHLYWISVLAVAGLLAALLAAVPGPPSTEFTRGFMVTTNQATAQAYLGVGGTSTQTVSVINVTNITVQNNLTVSNLYTVNGSHNLLIVTNAVRMPWVTLTLTGTNVQQIDLNAGSKFRVYLTNNAFFGGVANHPGTNISQDIQIALIENGAGAFGVTMTNSTWFLNGSSASANAQPTINTNANALTILTFVTSPTNAVQLLGVTATIAP